jgi:hypothetical protein
LRQTQAWSTARPPVGLMHKATDRMVHKWLSMAQASRVLLQTAAHQALLSLVGWSECR